MEINIDNERCKISSIDVGYLTIEECELFLERLKNINETIAAPSIDMATLLEHLSEEFEDLEIDITDGDEFEDICCGEESEKYLIECVDSYGGEDCGSEYWKVFKITDLINNTIVWIKFEGCYSSWDSTEWEDAPVFVAPKQKTVIVYEEIK